MTGPARGVLAVVLILWALAMLWGAGSQDHAQGRAVFLGVAVASLSLASLVWFKRGGRRDGKTGEGKGGA